MTPGLAAPHWIERFVGELSTLLPLFDEAYMRAVAGASYGNGTEPDPERAAFLYATWAVDRILGPPPQ